MKLCKYLFVSFSAILALAGCGGSSTTPPPPVNGHIYVTTASKDLVSAFKAGDNGNVSPQGQLTVAPNGPAFISMDVPHDRLAINSNGATPAITLVDNASAMNNAVGPIPGFRVLSGASITRISACALDGTRDLLYAAQGLGVVGTGAVLVFGPASTINGNIAPLRTFTLAIHLGGFLLDAVNDRLFLSDPVTNTISVFDNASTLTGSVIPARVISGANTQLNAPHQMVLDSSGRLIVSTSQSPNIVVFQNAATANGNIAPSASSTISQGLSEMAISPAGELYVVDGSPQVTVYGGVATATGAINPIRVIAGPNTGLGPIFPNIPAEPLGIAVDSTR